MKVIEGGFGKPEEEEERQASASDTCQATADMLSEMEEEDIFTEPECLIILAWKGVPALIVNNVEDLNRVSVLLDFAKADVLGAIAVKEAEETGIYEGDDDDTLH